VCVQALSLSFPVRYVCIKRARPTQRRYTNAAMWATGSTASEAEYRLMTSQEAAPVHWLKIADASFRAGNPDVPDNHPGKISEVRGIGYVVIPCAERAISGQPFRTLVANSFAPPSTNFHGNLRTLPLPPACVLPPCGPHSPVAPVALRVAQAEMSSPLTGLATAGLPASPGR
jgi:hypothetical protein